MICLKTKFSNMFKNEEYLKINNTCKNEGYI